MHSMLRPERKGHNEKLLLLTNLLTRIPQPDILGGNQEYRSSNRYDHSPVGSRLRIANEPAGIRRAVSCYDSIDSAGGSARVLRPRIRQFATIPQPRWWRWILTLDAAAVYFMGGDL